MTKLEIKGTKHRKLSSSDILEMVREYVSSSPYPNMQDIDDILYFTRYNARGMIKKLDKKYHIHPTIYPTLDDARVAEKLKSLELGSKTKRKFHKLSLILFFKGKHILFVPLLPVLMLEVYHQTTRDKIQSILKDVRDLNCDYMGVNQKVLDRAKKVSLVTLLEYEAYLKSECKKIISGLSRKQLKRVKSLLENQNWFHSRYNNEYINYTSTNKEMLEKPLIYLLNQALLESDREEPSCKEFYHIFFNYSFQKYLLESVNEMLVCGVFINTCPRAKLPKFLYEGLLSLGI